MLALLSCNKTLQPSGTDLSLFVSYLLLKQKFNKKTGYFWFNLFYCFRFFNNFPSR